LYNHTFKHDFEKIISLARKSKPTADDLEESSRLLEFHCYDIPMAKDYTERFKFLTEHVADKYSMVVLVDATIINDKEQMDKFLGTYLESGYEGQMIRIPKGPYENKRSKTLLKNKEFEDAEFEIVEVLEGLGNWKNYGKSVVIKLENGDTQQSGMKGNFVFAREILEQKDALVGTTVTVRFQNRTGDGKLRFPVVQTFWKGKRDV
jgi:DNA ligase-1